MSSSATRRKLARLMQQFEDERPDAESAEGRQQLRQLRGQTALLTPEPEHTLKFARLLVDLYRECECDDLGEAVFRECLRDILGLTEVHGEIHSISRQQLSSIGIPTDQYGEADIEGFTVRGYSPNYSEACQFAAISLTGVPELTTIAQITD